MTRGVGNELLEMQTAFEWRAPDGSSVAGDSSNPGVFQRRAVGLSVFLGRHVAMGAFDR